VCSRALAFALVWNANNVHTKQASEMNLMKFDFAQRERKKKPRFSAKYNTFSADNIECAGVFVRRILQSGVT